MAFSPNGSHKEKACKQFFRDEKSGLPLFCAVASTQLAHALGTGPLFYLKPLAGDHPQADNNSHCPGQETVVLVR